MQLHDQYVTSGYGLVAFTSGKWTKYAPNHLIADESAEKLNHLWIYSVDAKGTNDRARLIGHNYSLKDKLRTHWRTFRKNMQIVKREFDGMNR